MAPVYYVVPRHLPVCPSGLLSGPQAGIAAILASDSVQCSRQRLSGAQWTTSCVAPSGPRRPRCCGRICSSPACLATELGSPIRLMFTNGPQYAGKVIAAHWFLAIVLPTLPRLQRNFRSCNETADHAINQAKTNHCVARPIKGGEADARTSQATRACRGNTASPASSPSRKRRRACKYGLRKWPAWRGPRCPADSRRPK